MSDPTASIAVSSLVVDIAPYVIAVASVVIPVLLAMAVKEFQKLTGIQISQAELAKADTLAKAEAGALIAASETNLAGVAIPVGSKLLVGAVDRILDEVPNVLPPSVVATMVAGHLGTMQASSPAAAPVGVKP